MRPPCPPACLLACLAACTFTGPIDVSGGDGGGGGGGDGDGSGGEWRVVDTVIVSSRGEPVLSTFVLKPGVEYRLRASGTYFFALQTLGDAEFFDFEGGPPQDAAVNVDIGLAVNDPVRDLTRTPKWGTYRADHIYEVSWTGNGAPLTAQLHDGQYNDNSGNLTLEILALQ